MKQTGQLLRESREKKGVTLNEVAMATKINVKVLEAMEDGDIESLPSKAFLRGFVQTYANYLKLDSKAILHNFNDEMGFQEPKPKTAEGHESAPADTPPEHPATPHVSPAPAKASMPRPLEESQSSTMQRVFIGIGVLTVILVIKLLFTTIEKYERESKTPSPSEIESAIKEQPIKHEPPAEQTITAPPAAQPGPAVAVPAPEKPGTAETKPAATTKPATPTPPAQPATEKPAATAVVPTPEKTAPKPEPAKSTSDAKRSLLGETGASIQNKELIIEALDSVEIVFSIDSGPAKRTRLDTDKIHIIKAENSINVEVSDGGAINVIFNGQDLGVPGTVGKPMKLNYP